MVVTAGSNSLLSELADSDGNQLIYPLLVKTFYSKNNNSLFWFTRIQDKKELRLGLAGCLDTAMAHGLLAKPYHHNSLQQNIEAKGYDSAALMRLDMVFTDAAIASMKDIHQGYETSPWFGLDQVSQKYKDSIDELLLDLLIQSKSPGQLNAMMSSLEPKTAEYNSLKRELATQQQENDLLKIRQVILSMNYYRRIHHFHFAKTIVVNIASTYLRYYERDSVVLLMKTVVGKPSTPTPRFATWCDQVILYPYWYVPRSITLKEYLHRFKANPSLVDAFNMQVIDNNGTVIDHHKLNWSLFSKKYFPFILRQSTGCDNALGVIKFNLTSPYGVYLHDTNNKTAFFSARRYYSHGCIRIEDPIGLGNRLLVNQLDTTFLQSCFKEQKPIPIILENIVPVFVVYMPVETLPSGSVCYYKDVYKLLK